MKKAAPSKEPVVTIATPLASKPPPVVILETETATEEQPVTEKTKATEEQPEPAKAKATEEETVPEKAKATVEEPAPEKAKAIVEKPAPEKATSSRAQEATKTPTSEIVELVISDVRKAFPLPSAEFSGLLQMLDRAHKVSVLFCISSYSLVTVVPEAPIGS